MNSLQPPKKGAMTNVKTPQSLVHIKHNITARQYKYWYVLLKLYRDMVDAGEEADKNGFRFVPLATMTELLGYEPVKTELRKDFEALRQQPIIINYLEKDGSKATHGMGFLSEWKVSSKRIGFRFPSFIEEVVRGEDDAKKMFLLLNWNIFNSFTGKYEAIIYKLCKDYIGVGRTPYMTIDDYREYIGLSDLDYPSTDDFNKRCVKNPIIAINKNELSDITVIVDYRRDGRKILGLWFNAELKKQRQLPFEEFKPHPAFDYAKVSISSEEQIKYLEKYTPEQVQAIIERANEYAKDLTGKGKQAKLGGIYQKAFSEDWGKNLITQKVDDVKQEKAIDTKRKVESEERRKERESEEKSKRDKEELKRIISIFETQTESMQDVIIDAMEKIIQSEKNNFLMGEFRIKRNKNEAHKSLILQTHFKKAMQENGLI